MGCGCLYLKSSFLMTSTSNCCKDQFIVLMILAPQDPELWLLAHCFFFPMVCEECGNMQCMVASMFAGFARFGCGQGCRFFQCRGCFLLFATWHHTGFPQLYKIIFNSPILCVLYFSVLNFWTQLISRLDESEILAISY